MIVPMLELETTDGTPFDWRALWQRHNLLVLVSHPECESCMRVLADWDGKKDALVAENTTPIAIFTGRPESLPERVAVILDPDERFAGALGISQGTVIAADRFFEVLATENVHHLGADEAAFDSIDWVRLAERQCPECGVGTW